MKFLSHLAIASLGVAAGAIVGGCLPVSDSADISSTAAISSAASDTPEAESITPSVTDMATGHRDYVAVELDMLPTHVEPVGTDPEAIALQLFSPGEPVEGFFEQTVESKQGTDQAVVTLTQTGLPDDSIKGMRYRLEFAPTETGEWELMWVGKQYTCRPGRGSQEWTTEWCS